MQFAPTLTWARGDHTFKAGYDWRQLRQTEISQGWRGGAYAFDGTYTRASSTAVSQYGQGIASFMLGLPLNASFIEVRPEQDYNTISHGFFVHDDWRIGERLTLNVGVRYDLELGLTEAENRNTRGFDFATPNPIQAQAQAQYAANPPAGVPLTAAQFAVLGGYQYVDDADRAIWAADTNNFQPRFGFTYTLSPSVIVRGGAGLFISPFQINAVPGLGNPVNQLGYSRQTPVPVSADNGLTFQANLTNPVPSGQLLEPVGSSLGLRTASGGNAAGIIRDRADQSRILALQRRPRKTAGRQLAGRGVVPGPEGIQRALHRAGELRAAAVSHRRARSATTTPRRSSARWCPTHSRA